MNAQSIAATELILSGIKNSSTSKTTGATTEYAKILRKTLARNNIFAPITTVKRFRPDGSIMINTYRDGSLIGQHKITPHLVPIPDLSAPPQPDGSPEIKMVPRLSLVELLML